MKTAGKAYLKSIPIGICVCLGGRALDCFGPSDVCKNNRKRNENPMEHQWKPQEKQYKLALKVTSISRQVFALRMHSSHSTGVRPENQTISTDLSPFEERHYRDLLPMLSNCRLLIALLAPVGKARKTIGKVMKSI